MSCVLKKLPDNSPLHIKSGLFRAVEGAGPVKLRQPANDDVIIGGEWCQCLPERFDLEGAMKRVVRLVFVASTLPFNLRCHCGGFFVSGLLYVVDIFESADIGV